MWLLMQKWRLIVTDRPVVLVRPPNEVNLAMVRWFQSVQDAERNRSVIVVTHKGIEAGAQYVNDVPDEWIKEASRAYEILRNDPNGDVSSFATHTNSVAHIANSPLIPVGNAGDGSR